VIVEANILAHGPWWLPDLRAPSPFQAERHACENAHVTSEDEDH